MAKAKQSMTEADMASRSRRQGGSHSLADIHRGPQTGVDGAIQRAVYGDDPLDFEKAIERELSSRQESQPDRFVRKVVRRGASKRG